MIRIQKNEFPPEVRFTNGDRKGLLKCRVFTAELLRKMKNAPDDFGTNSLKCIEGFAKDYGKAEYRVELIKNQGSKCCYCEKAEGDAQLEHFRPKAGYQNGPGDSISRPSYYWLAYSWKNLLLSCSTCNSSGKKGNYFPINGVRATGFKSNLVDEQPILIDPSKEEPSKHITFNFEMPVALGSRGQVNIDTYDLKNRADLKSAREDRLSRYRLAKEYVDNNIIPPGHTQSELNKLKLFFYRAMKNSSPFAGMMRENFRKGLI